MAMTLYLLPPTDALDATRRRPRLGGKKRTSRYQHNYTISGLASRVTDGMTGDPGGNYGFYATRQAESGHRQLQRVVDTSILCHTSHS